ncbi:hypothetical protein F5J12DRAFT_889007 [Pisolithus orientalis]|uniref:uncharacterized protein n=1 Tax=Pisolithus orientalis TaxID=936130 RepID=UPI0022254968|nr:uncharacterized protein F5J12DRAFT_889007 [Pisolithus orientalis]KAI6028485.1 hypothetical protein F5J12DRAFT_889007 [Pisolithus orientalis]
MASALTLPAPLKKAFSLFPLQTYPPVSFSVRFPLVKPTLWIAPPRKSSASLLSTDVECLKWQAFIAIRGLVDIAVRWDISPEGALGGRLPTLHVPNAGSEGHLLPAEDIPSWVDNQSTSGVDTLDGYKDERAKDESHAWVSLLEGVVHAALTLSGSTPSPFDTFIHWDGNKGRPIEALLNPPPAPLTGFNSFLPAFGANISLSALQPQYTEAISALSERLGEDTWFLGSANPTFLDALLFAYLHCILHSGDVTRLEVTRRTSLVAWERRVRTKVEAAFCVAPRR